MTDLRVYYDGACPVCSREIAFYRRKAASGAIAWIDAATAAEDVFGPDLTRCDALRRLHARTADGRLISGAAAFAAIWRHYPGLRWLGRLIGTPPFSWMAEGTYRLFLRVRPWWRRS